MRKYENECVGCEVCIGSHCPNKNVLRFYCDKCGEEAKLFHYDGKELCIDCIEGLLEKVEE